MSESRTDVVMLSVFELACRLAEAFNDGTRPAGMTAREAVLALEENEGQGVLRAAHAAIEYILGEISRAIPGKVTQIRDEPDENARPN